MHCCLVNHTSQLRENEMQGTLLSASSAAFGSDHLKHGLFIASTSKVALLLARGYLEHWLLLAGTGVVALFLARGPLEHRLFFAGKGKVALLLARDQLEHRLFIVHVLLDLKLLHCP